MDSKDEIQQYGSKENGNAVVQYSVSGSNTVKVGETITLTCNNKFHWPSHNWYTFGNSVAVEGDTDSNTITVKGLKEGTATVYCSGDSKQINVTDPQYVIRFYVSGTGTKGLYTEKQKYSIADQPNSTFESATGKNPLALSVSAGYAILTDYNDTAKGITTSEFTNVRVEGDEAVREWLTTYANRGVQDGLTDRNNVEKIVDNVNKQYTYANDNYYKDKGITLPLLKTNHYNGFRFVDAYYVPSGESTIHVNVQLVKNTEYIVRYEPNGGAGDAYEDSTLYLNGQQAPVKSNTFTKAGYRFTGWNTEANGTGTSYNPNGNNNRVTIGGADVTLYAQWEAKEYTVKYDLNYEGAQNPTDRNNVHWNDANLLPSGSFTREGYSFDNWYTATTGGEMVTDATTYASIAGNDATPSVTLYAHWNQNSEPTTESTPVYVYFKIVDAAGNNIKDKSKINNDDLKNTAYNNDADKKTWATLGKIASAETLTDSTEYKGTNTTLATVGNEAKDQLKNDDALHTDNKKIANTVLANIEWFQLKQWAGATGYVSDGSRWHLDGKITGYTVTYNNGTTEATNNVNNMPDADEMYYLRGSEYTVSDATPTREGYVFTGWKSNIENDTTIHNAKEKFEMPAKNVVLTAQWEEIYTVTFNAGDNGTLGGNLTQTGVSGTTLTEPTRTPNIGYEFVGWVKDNTLVNAIPNTITENATYTATWKLAEVPPTNAKYTVKHHKWDVAQNKYIEDTSKLQSYDGTIGEQVNVTDKATSYEGYVLNKQVSELTGKVTADNKLTLNLYYDIDKIGGGKNKDQPDGIPDRYQVTINYVSSNTNWGSVNRSKEVITLINKESSKWAETGTVTAPSCTATSAGGKCYFVNWTKKQEGSTASSTVTSSANLPEQLIENAKGGDVYTFTANFDRSSGGGSGGSNRPKPPVVEIPDDVPTGLNGKDHYAYIIGYGNNDVRPQNNITRAEVATIFFRLLTDETREANMTKSNGYNDVKNGDWFCCAVSTLSKMGIIKGYEDGSFKPNDPISRAEFAAIAARFDPDGDKTPATFADVTSHWAKDEISIAANHGWIKGYEDGSFKPDQKITRAETMTLVNRVLNRLPETKDDLHKDMKTWVDNMDETAWYYLAVQEATNSHYFKNKTGTKFEQWTDLRDTRDWSELEK